MIREHHDPPRKGPMGFFCCFSCTRCFVAAGDVKATEIICVCGARLQPSSLARGVYELASAVPEDAAITCPRSGRRSLDPAEAHDLGYGASHGLPPGHEGPTGPGDAPAR
ncbi:Hypothetical protein A7982_10788 [Minicystis rosea]|nr:Hypothetical protein A7982_10788 [Minicystis rosea]